MAQTLSPNNKLYLYRLLTHTFGIGTQTFLPHVEEALSNEGINPYDLGYRDIRQFMEALDDFVELTDFKGGRTYVRILRLSSFDDALTSLEDNDVLTSPSKKDGKPWKHKKIALKPIKPLAQLTKREPKASHQIRTEMDSEKEATAPDTATAEKEPVVKETIAETTEQRQITETDSPDVAKSSSNQAIRIDELPISFWDEVHCSDALLGILIAALPLGYDIHLLLEKDWHIARATKEMKASRSKVSFPLRFLQANGTPITVTIVRKNNGLTKKRWSLSNVEADEGVDAGIEGASLISEGAWIKLSALYLPPETRRSLLDELGNFMSFNGWNNLCEQLSNLAAPESWDIPGKEHGFHILREYLLVTIARLKDQGKLPIDTDTNQALWNTGLITSSAQPIYCVLDASYAGSPTPWSFKCFTTADHIDLPQLVKTAQRATYLEDIPTLNLATNPLSISPSLEVDSATAEAALQRACANWRELVPVWDPQDRHMKFLINLPERKGAFVVEQNSDNSLSLTTQLSLTEAYICARIISVSQPDWLNPDNIFI